MTGDVELTNLTAQKAVELLKLGEIVPSELVDAVAKRIEEVNCQVNALPTLCLDKAYEQCSMLIKPDAEDAGWLAGLPIVVKDLNEIEDVLTTYGSNIFSNHILYSFSFHV